MLKYLLVLILIVLLIPTTIQARTTPEDIVNARYETYNQKLKNYSEPSKVKLADFEKKIAKLNHYQSQRLDQIMIRQGEILDEYMFRNKITPAQETDGIQRNLSDPVENARYWITYAHEAVAYQAAKVYLFELSGESNIKRDINSQINALQSDMNVLVGKVNKSQKIVEDLVK